MNMLELLTHTDICGVPTGASLNFILLLTTGLLSGFSHCVGMCGPLVSTFVVHQRAQRTDATTALLIYQLGRLSAYALLGLLAGVLGSLVRVGVVAQGWQSSASVVVGVSMAIAGINLLGFWPLSRPLLPQRLLHTIHTNIRRSLTLTNPLAHFGLGLSNALLPCGPVYTVLLLAATTGDGLRGAFAMFIFGLGTLPAMIGVGLFAARVTLGLRSNFYRLAAALVVLVGIQLTLRGLALSHQVAHFAVAGVMLW